jgi:hypothetical protein
VHVRVVGFSDSDFEFVSNFVLAIWNLGVVMIECPYCYRVFRQPPEKLGARCPKCRMPLYEDPSKRRKNPDKDYGRCEQHPEAQAVTRCSRCDKPICQVCRTRWHEEPVCPRCVDESIADDEPSPREAQMQTKHAWISVILSAAGWMILLMTLAPYSTFHAGQVTASIKFVTYSSSWAAFSPPSSAWGAPRRRCGCAATSGNLQPAAWSFPARIWAWRLGSSC